MPQAVEDPYIQWYHNSKELEKKGPKTNIINNISNVLRQHISTLL